jgi:microcystin-dependent protein
LSTTYAPINSPSFTGTPTAPTQPATDNSNKLANTLYVNTLVNNNKGNLKPQIVQSADFTLQASETGSPIAIIGTTIQNITLPRIDTQNNFCILYNQTNLEINLLKGTGITSINVPTIKPFESLTFFHDGGPAWKLVNALSYRKHEIDDKLNFSRPYAILGTIIEEYIESGTPSAIITEANGVKKFLLNGQTITQAQAPELFTKKGWSGSKVLQNRGGRVALQVGTGYNVGTTGGSATHQLTINEMPNHNHKLTLQNDILSGGNARRSTLRGDVNYSDTAIDGSNPAVSYEGGGQPHNNMQPYIVSAFYIIGW